MGRGRIAGGHRAEGRSKREEGDYHEEDYVQY
jgi:hypothetical protein